MLLVGAFLGGSGFGCGLGFGLVGGLVVVVG